MDFHRGILEKNPTETKILHSLKVDFYHSPIRNSQYNVSDKYFQGSQRKRFQINSFFTLCLFHTLYFIFTNSETNDSMKSSHKIIVDLSSKLNYFSDQVRSLQKYILPVLSVVNKTQGK